jgi:hypothetical protein
MPAVCQTEQLAVIGHLPARPRYASKRTTGRDEPPEKKLRTADPVRVGLMPSRWSAPRRLPIYVLGWGATRPGPWRRCPARRTRRLPSRRRSPLREPRPGRHALSAKLS